MVEFGIIVVILILSAIIFLREERASPGSEDPHPLTKTTRSADAGNVKPTPHHLNTTTGSTEPAHTITWHTVQVVGTSFRNPTGVNRQDCIIRTCPSDEIWLERDTSNTHDPNALRVMSRHGQLGFIPRGLAAELATIDSNKLSANFLSKGRASNGLWGCSIRLGTPPTVDPAASKPALNSSDTGFKKASALQAAREGRLSYSQLLAVIDRAQHLGLEPHEVEVFETARRYANPPPPPAPWKKPPRSVCIDDFEDYPEQELSKHAYSEDDGYDGIDSYWHEYHKHD